MLFGRVQPTTIYFFIASLNALPGANRGTFFAGIWMVFPVRGFLPVRAERINVEKEPKPINVTFSPFATDFVIVTVNASTIASAVFFVVPAFFAIASTKSTLFMPASFC
jgi:hypothetical protein